MIKYYKIKVKTGLKTAIEFLNSSQDIKLKNKNDKFGRQSASS